MPPRTAEFKVDTYKRSVAAIKNRLNSIKRAVDQLYSQTEPLSIVEQNKLTVYLKEVESKKSEFESLMNHALTLSDGEELTNDTLFQDQDHVFDLHIHISSHIEALIHTNETSTNSDTPNESTISDTTSQLRLPKLDLPKFNGELANWTSFINLFDITIHNNVAIPAVMKFQYLLSVLQGEPFKLVKSLSITSENYAIAYKLLHDRYHNIRRLQSLHLNQLLDLPTISASHIPSLRQFVNMFTENSQALTALKCPVQESNPLLSAVLLRKLDIELRKRLETFRSNKHSAQHTMPEVQEIIDFLTMECNNNEDATLHSVSRASVPNPVSVRNRGYTSQKVTYPQKTVAMLTTPSPSAHPQTSCLPIYCFVCNKTSHKVYTCPSFKNNTPNERYQLVKSQHRCVSCLGTHDLKHCQSQSTCRICHKRHHTLLHFNNDKFPTIQTQSNKVPVVSKSTTAVSKLVPDEKEEVTATLTTHDISPKCDSNVTVLLGTLLLQLRTPDGGTHIFRALLDSGSMCDLISEHAANILNVRRQKSDIQLTGISQNVTHNRGQISVDVTNLSGQLIASRHSFLILNKLTADLPRVPISPHVLKHAQSYVLADPNFHVPGRIDVILGCSLFSQLFTNEQHHLGPHMPVILGTRFGFVVMGTAPCLSTESHSNNLSFNSNMCLHATTATDLHASIQRFWQQEEPPSCSIKTLEDDICDKHFTKTHTRDNTGRYIVRLPFKEDRPSLGTSRQAAETRLVAMERKFSANPRFSQLYHDFMDEYQCLCHMSECSDDIQDKQHYFLPHHGVLKESSSTTKLRTVFDASCKTSSGASLNDILLTGRKLQINICDLLMHFRKHNIVFCCDIRQMYRQILINAKDRNFQLILWRDSPQSPLTTYQLNTVTYGMNSSPYLAIRTLHQLADDEGQNFPQAAYAIKHHTYVDDIITGAATEADALELLEQLISLLQCGGFELRKWVSNSPNLLSNVPDTHLETPTFLQESQTPQFTVLGLQWSPSVDAFSYNFQIPLNTQLAKQTVLSTIAKVYDPCGFLTPLIMLMKCFMQLLWSKCLSWDERLPPDLVDQWQLITNDITSLKNITIPRSLCLTSSLLTELHGFCDASESGYAAVVYFRCEMPNNHIKIHPIIAKSRVAPLQRVTIPRLELCAANLLAQLVSYCRTIFPHDIDDNHIYLWSDSTIVLSWLRTPSFKLKTYVANRVANIQELVPGESWKHIASEQNPADCASRGLRATQLLNHSLWWNGPAWLSTSPCQWPMTNFAPLTLDTSHELKEIPLAVFTTNQSKEWSLLTKLSSWDTLVRVMALIIRFCHNCRSTNRSIGCLTSDELRSARIKIFTLVQQSSFSDEFPLLANQLDCTKRIQRLNPFLDKNGLIRVGGRLTNSSLSFDTQHPILLPKHHHVVHLLIDYYHIRCLHAGPQLVQSLLTQQVWILSARSTIRSQIHKCIICFKHRPKNVEPLMGDLPSSRITPAKPFKSTGIDYSGPFTIKMLNFRFVKQIKVYICLFICMVTKAVHIEVVTDLTTEAFLAALTRFMSRRGKCTDLYSDCGTNFVGANTVLWKMVQSILRTNDSKSLTERFIATNGIRFHFNPPASPHHGGLWESAIKSAKHHLRRVMGNTLLTLPEFITLTTRVEAMLNSRPLTPLSNDPSDLAALTPGHFLVGGPLVTLAEPDNSNTPQNRLKHWHLLRQLHLHIWRRWNQEYLHTLHQRTKWTRKVKNIKVGDLVLIHCSSSPLNWPLARVTAVHPGTDGIVRVVTLQTQTGTLTRPVTKVFPPPLSDAGIC